MLLGKHLKWYPKEWLHFIKILKWFSLYNIQTHKWNDICLHFYSIFPSLSLHFPDSIYKYLFYIRVAGILQLYARTGTPVLNFCACLFSYISLFELLNANTVVWNLGTCNSNYVFVNGLNLIHCINFLLFVL